MKRKNGLILSSGTNTDDLGRTSAGISEITEIFYNTLWPSVKIINSEAFINEGQTISIKLINVPDGTYTATAVLVSGNFLNNSDFQSNVSTFSIVVSSGVGTGTTTLALDGFTEGTEVINFIITNSLSVTIGATQNYTISDISTGVTEPVYTPSVYTTVTATSPSAFSYIAMPGGSRTFLNYITSFGVVGTSSNTASAAWNASYSGNIAYIASPIAVNNYFTLYNRVRFIDGDSSADAVDWAVINFGIANGNADFDGNAGAQPYFGGESSYSGGAGNVGMTIGRIWGFSTTVGWTLLYQLPLGTSSGGSYNHTNGSWFTSGTTVSTGNGKRLSYDTLTITHVGFSVGTS